MSPYQIVKTDFLYQQTIKQMILVNNLVFELRYD